MAEKTDTLDNILEHGIDLKNRRIYFGALPASYDEDGSDFTWRSVERAVRAIHIMESEAQHRPIELHMSSPGGDPFALLRLYDVIQSSPCQFKFYGSGYIMSAATWIMAGCDERYLYPNTRVLIHDSSAGGAIEVPTKLTDRYIDTDEEKRLQDILNRIYADNSRMPLEFWEEIVKRDLYLSAEETVLLGLADKIVEPKKRGNLRRSRIACLKKDVDRKEMNKILRTISSRLYQTKIARLELHVPEEKFDNTIIVDDSPVAEPAVEKPVEKKEEGQQ